MKTINVTIWNEFIHERTEPKIAAIYPWGIHEAIAAGIGSEGFQIQTASLEQPEHGLSEEVLNRTDVLVWWGHLAHEQVSDTVVDRIQARVLRGMGLIVLHAGHRSKIFKKLMGTTCDLKWRSDFERERLWVVDPSHPITEGIGEYIELEEEEMYGEFFDIPAPEELVFISWFQGGEVFRSGCGYQRGLGKIFYFRPGDQEYPTYYNKEVLRVIANAIRWAASPHGAEPVYGNTAPLEQMPSKIVKQYFGQTPDGQSVFLYVLRNINGMQAAITNYGGIVVSLKVPDRNGILEDVVLGYPTLEQYLRTGNKYYYGAIIGRYANRIANGRFTLDGVTYQLPINNVTNTLHGGIRGFDKRVWEAEEVYKDGEVGLALSYLSKDGEEGFPGNLAVKVIYTLTNNNELRIDYTAVTDKKTVVNLTQHNYYNLAGAGNGNILGHIVTINAERFTTVNADVIPTGQLQSVAGTPLDFRKPISVGSRIHSNDPQMQFASNGYDFNYVLEHDGCPIGFAAGVYEPQSGRLMEVYTSEPGVQFYTGQRIDGDIGKDGKVYPQYAGLALETQHFPDSPNHPNFPSTELSPGQTYKQTTIYKFSTL